MHDPPAMGSESQIGYRVALGLIFAGVVLSGLPHRLRADRAGGRMSLRGDPPWFWGLMTLVVPPLALVSLAFLIQPGWVDFAQLSLASGLRWLGVPFGLAGLALFAWMFRHLGLNVTSSATPRCNATLVTTGPYRWIRHPMYSAALLLAVAATLLTASVVIGIAGAAMFALLAARSRLEEQQLVAKFGEAYQVYQRGTGRFVPRSRRDGARAR
jgi:protein-S-isoprenylcysteine O-methyltransferase Ste14